jgi:hypothetical protein
MLLPEAAVASRIPSITACPRPMLGEFCNTFPLKADIVGMRGLRPFRAIRVRFAYMRNDAMLSLV